MKKETSLNHENPPIAVSGSASDFEQDLFKLINNYCKNGLSKPDLVRKMEWVTGNCKVS